MSDLITALRGVQESAPDYVKAEQYADGTVVVQQWEDGPRSVPARGVSAPGP